MITKDRIIEEVMRQHPETIAVFRRFGLDCNECQIAAFEEVGHGAGVHAVDVEALLTELNRAIGAA